MAETDIFLGFFGYSALAMFGHEVYYFERSDEIFANDSGVVESALSHAKCHCVSFL